ncbi:MAG: parE2 [Betaproteobacteria bacterium]|nr:parE2 [Betaproteobacteria bacterium]
MTSRAVFFAPGAEEDLRDALLWYRERNQAAAQAFRAEVYAAIDRIASTSSHLAPDENNTRKRLLKRYPYSVIYRLEESHVTIVAVAHHRRRPGYWR